MAAHQQTKHEERVVAIIPFLCEAVIKHASDQSHSIAESRTRIAGPAKNGTNREQVMAPVREVPMYQVDAFSAVPFGGNPAAVCLLSSSMSDSLRQSLAAENNLSETAFVEPVRVVVVT